MEDIIQSPAIVTNRNIWFVSDTHFGHANILKFKTNNGDPLRVFESVEHMNETMVENWNSRVKSGDIVYHLGDVYFGQGGQVLPRLMGRKRLILGNHDTAKNQDILNNFQKILMWRMFPEFELLLTHVPVHPGSLEMKVRYNIHGHLHRNMVKNETGLDKRYINVCVENINYTPIHLEEILELIKTIDNE